MRRLLEYCLLNNTDFSKVIYSLWLQQSFGPGILLWPESCPIQFRPEALFLLGEPVTVVHVLSGTLILAGVIISTRD
jgi:hypothetical protein